MDNRYTTLATLAGIVQETAHSTMYACTPREMILHSTFDWDMIHKHLLALTEEGLVLISQAESLQFSITQAGLDKVAGSDKKINVLGDRGQVTGDSYILR